MSHSISTFSKMADYRYEPSATRSSRDGTRARREPREPGRAGGRSGGYRYDMPVPRSPRSRRGRSAVNRRHNRTWAKWLVLGWSGSLVAAWLAWQADDIRRLDLGDPSLRSTVLGILIVVLVSFPGFALFRLGKLSQGNSWVESQWKPTLLAWLSVALSMGAAMWSGYLIAIRVARDLTL